LTKGGEKKIYGRLILQAGRKEYRRRDYPVDPDRRRDSGEKKRGIKVRERK